MMFLDCPAYLDGDGALRCGLPAEVADRVTMESTGGPVEILKISCPAGHWFNGPLDSLALPAAEPAADPAASPAANGASESATADPRRTR
jgi:hypothetical protein